MDDEWIRSGPYLSLWFYSSIKHWCSPKSSNSGLHGFFCCITYYVFEGKKRKRKRNFLLYLKVRWSMDNLYTPWLIHFSIASPSRLLSQSQREREIFLFRIKIFPKKKEKGSFNELNFTFWAIASIIFFNTTFSTSNFVKGQPWIILNWPNLSRSSRLIWILTRIKF